MWVTAKLRNGHASYEDMSVLLIATCRPIEGKKSLFTSFAKFLKLSSITFPSFQPLQVIVTRH